MFDINSGEMLIIALVALIVFGPQRLPELLRKAGSFLREMRAMGAELQRGLERDIAELKAPVNEIKDDLTKPVQDLRDEITAPVDEVRRELSAAADDLDAAPQVAGLSWKGPIPASGPTPDDALADLERIDAGEDLVQEPEE